MRDRFSVGHWETYLREWEASQSLPYGNYRKTGILYGRPVSKLPVPEWCDPKDTEYEFTDRIESHIVGWVSEVFKDYAKWYPSFAKPLNLPPFSKWLASHTSDLTAYLPDPDGYVGWDIEDNVLRICTCDRFDDYEVTPIPLPDEIIDVPSPPWSSLRARYPKVFASHLRDMLRMFKHTALETLNG